MDGMRDGRKLVFNYYDGYPRARKLPVENVEIRIGGYVRYIARVIPYVV